MKTILKFPGAKNRLAPWINAQIENLDYRECLKSVHNSLLCSCNIDFWSEKGKGIFMTFNYGINELLSNIAKSEAEEREAVKFPPKNKGSK